MISFANIWSSKFEQKKAGHCKSVSEVIKQLKEFDLRLLSNVAPVFDLAAIYAFIRTPELSNELRGFQVVPQEYSKQCSGERNTSNKSISILFQFRNQITVSEFMQCASTLLYLIFTGETFAEGENSSELEWSKASAKSGRRNLWNWQRNPARQRLLLFRKRWTRNWKLKKNLKGKKKTRFEKRISLVFPVIKEKYWHYTQVLEIWPRQLRSRVKIRLYKFNLRFLEPYIC